MPPSRLRAEPDLVAHLGFILAEEESLKQWFSGITVPTRPGELDRTEVGVWFRFPEGGRQLHYPFITLDLLSVDPEYSLMTSTFWQDTRGLYQPSFSPTLPPVPPGMNARVREYLPFTLTFQVAHYSRSSLHDRYLTSIFATDLLPVHPFWITTPADGVARRTERLGFTANDTIETTESGTKRIFRKIYTLTMLTEVPQNYFDHPDGYLAYQALRVLIPVVAQEQFDQYFAHVLKDRDDPMGELSDEQRAEEGEFFYVAHEGRNAPSA